MRKNSISRMRLALAALVVAGMAVITPVTTRQVSAGNAVPPSGSINHQPKQMALQSNFYEIKDQAGISVSAENVNRNLLEKMGNILSLGTQVLPPPVPNTIVASTGAIDEGSLGRYAFMGPWVSYRHGSESLEPIEIRYNVPANNIIKPTPGWNTLELTSQVPAAGSFALATLFRVEPCSGEQVPLCTTVNNGSNMPRCTTCPFAPGAIDFDHYLYYIRVELGRSDQPDPPRAAALRLLQD